MYDSLIRLRSIIRLSIHKDNNDLVGMGGTKGFKVFKHQFEEWHYKGISKLQDHYGKKIATSNKKSNKAVWKKVLERLHEIKQKQLYTTKEKIWLNNLREHYLLDKKTTPSF